MFKSLFLVSLIVGVLCILAVAVVPVSGVSIQYQTIPTRTSRPPAPTKDNGGDDDDNDDDSKPPPIATEQATPTATPTATPLSVTLVPTPDGGYLSAAEPCDANPTVQTLGQTNVRAGPGIGYDSVAMLVFLEVRPIIGRAEFSDWWLVELADGSSGWVFDQVVIVQGYTGYVPISEAPELEGDGVPPTPGTSWDPTPNPVCTPPPSPTPTMTTEPTRTQLPSPTASAKSQPTLTPKETSSSTATTTSTPTATRTSEPEIETSMPSPSITPSSQVTAETINSDGFDTSWILFAGLGLVIIGGIGFLLQRRGG
jgi:uncharacterized protein YraI